MNLDGSVNQGVEAGNYLFNEKGELWSYDSDNTMLGFRYWIENKTDKVLTFDGDGDGVITGISTISATTAAKRGVFTIDGRFLGRDVDSRTLPAGIYIVDGHKVVVK